MADGVTTFEIINPSDPYTIRGTFEACAVVTLFLGSGLYGLTVVDGDPEERTLPPLAFAGEVGLVAWARKALGIDDLAAWLNAHLPEVIAAAESVVIGNLADRKLYEDTLADLPEEARPRFRERWHDRKRTSMNDIGTAAAKLAAAWRECIGATAGVPA